MKIELKNTDFKYLVEWIEVSDGNIHIPLIYKELKNQYDKAFNKYQNEKQEFEMNEKVQFRWPGRNTIWWDGKIKKISRRADGKYLYQIEYEDNAEDYDFDDEKEIENMMVKRKTHPLTNKNIRKVKQ